MTTLAVVLLVLLILVAAALIGSALWTRSVAAKAEAAVPPAGETRAVRGGPQHGTQGAARAHGGGRSGGRGHARSAPADGPGRSAASLAQAPQAFRDITVFQAFTDPRQGDDRQRKSDA